MKAGWTLVLALAVLAAPAAAADPLGGLPRRNGAPLEATPGLDTDHGAVRTSDGYRLRSLVTRPAGASGRLPAIFLTQWVSCGSIEFRPNRESSLRALALRSGLAMIRVERAGSGDSEGPPCARLDYDTEVRHYR